MAATSYTLLDVAQIVSHRTGLIDANVETLSTPGPLLKDLIESINEVMRKMYQVKPFPEMHGRHLFATVDDLIADGGTDKITKLETTTITTAGTSTADYDNGLVSITETGLDCTDVPFRITTATATALTPAENWQFALQAGPVDYSYSVGVDRYSLPADFGDFVSASYAGPASGTLKYLSAEDFAHQRYTMRSTIWSTGEPRYITCFDILSNTWMCEIDPIPDDVYGITLRYKKTLTKLDADADPIPIPDEHISALITGAVALIKSTHGAGEEAARYEVWKKTELVEYATMGNKRTDPKPQIQPADVMRQPPGSTRF
jgi:hypothetical protein